MHTIDRPSSLGPSFGKMMVHRILKPLLVFMLLGISSICEAGPTKVHWTAGLYRLWRFAEKHPEATKNILIGLVVLFALSAVVMLIMVISQWLWKQIKSIAWFRKQNSEAETTGSGMIATVNHTGDDTSICSNGGEERNADD